jgi:hypothetical protein
MVFEDGWCDARDVTELTGMTDVTSQAANAHGAAQVGGRLDEEWLLGRAAELVCSGWCQGALARDRHGREVEPWSDSAHRWSLLGAVLAAWLSSERSKADFLSAESALSRAVSGHVEEWNDAPWRTRTHVLSALRRAPLWLHQGRSEGEGGTMVVMPLIRN